MKISIKFLKFRFVGYVVSLVLFGIFITGTVLNGGFNWGIDFIGGIKIIARFEGDIDVSRIRQALAQNGIDADVQQYGSEELNEYVISTRLPEGGRGSGRKGDKKEEISGSGRIQAVLTRSFNNVGIIGVEEVGPAIGEYLKKNAIYLLLWCMVLMMVYLAFRFEFRFSVGAGIDCIRSR